MVLDVVIFDCLTNYGGQKFYWDIGGGGSYNVEGREQQWWMRDDLFSNTWKFVWQWDATEVRLGWNALRKTIVQSELPIKCV